SRTRPRAAPGWTRSRPITWARILCACSSSRASISSRSVRRATSTRFRPSRAMRRARDAPMPLEAPVTSVTSSAMTVPSVVVEAARDGPGYHVTQVVDSPPRSRHQAHWMANLTLAEFTEAVTALAEHHGVEQLRGRSAGMNASTPRRGLNSAAALAERLHLLTGGLRRQVPATYAFSSLWTDMIGSRLGEEGEKQLEELAERVNACLDGQDAVVEGREADLDQALASYR